MQARAVLAAMPKGRYVMIMGSPVDPNAGFLRGGQQEVLQDAITKGDITIVGETYTDDWQCRASTTLSLPDYHLGRF